VSKRSRNVSAIKYENLQPIRRGLAKLMVSTCQRDPGTKTFISVVVVLVFGLTLINNSFNETKQVVDEGVGCQGGGGGGAPNRKIKITTADE
jgi:hypothetical protein